MAPVSPVPQGEPRRLSVAEYEALVAAGEFGPDDRLELLEGVLVEKLTKSPAHSAATRLTRAVLTPLVPSGWFVETQEPIATEDSEPEPDIAIVRGVLRDYSTRHPTAAEVALVVEVAETSLRRDRGIKARIYAKAGVPSYWIVNLAARSVEVCERPGERGYAVVMTYTEPDEVPVVLDGNDVGSVRVSEMLPLV